MRGYSGNVLLTALMLITNGGLYMAQSAQQCIPGKARLVNGTEENAGLLEVCTENSTWSTVCYNYFSCNDRNVACRQAGYDGSFGYYGGYNRGIKPKLGFYLCAGTENSLSDCSKRLGFSISTHCATTLIVGLKCTKKSDENCPTQNAIRLFGGAKKSEGQLQICRNKKWRDVCDGSSDSQALGYVACRELGYSGNWVSTSHNRHFYNTTTVPFAYTRISCYSKNYQKISYCSIYSDTSCYYCYGREVAITCEIEKTNCKERDLRLVGGPTTLEGWVEMCVDGLWGRVTGKVEGNTKDLICSALGFNETGAVVVNSYTARRNYESSNSPPLVKYINCCDRDKTFQTCDMHYAKVTDTLSQNQEYALRCIDGCTHNQMRLVGGSSKHEGVVEMCISGTWRTVGVNQWDDTDANVVCQHLYPGQRYAYAVATNSSEFQASTRQVYYDYFRCNGAELNVGYCSKNYAYSSYTPEETAAVLCHPVCNC